jgi:hypothetical protein
MPAQPLRRSDLLAPADAEYASGTMLDPRDGETSDSAGAVNSQRCPDYAPGA